MHVARSMSSPASPSTDVGRKVVHRKEIDYTNLWPIFLAPVIPAAGILLRCGCGRLAKRTHSCARISATLVTDAPPHPTPDPPVGRIRGTGGRSSARSAARFCSARTAWSSAPA